MIFLVEVWLEDVTQLSERRLGRNARRSHDALNELSHCVAHKMAGIAARTAQQLPQHQRRNQPVGKDEMIHGNGNIGG
jgi:hypothetical protein